MKQCIPIKIGDGGAMKRNRENLALPQPQETTKTKPLTPRTEVTSNAKRGPTLGGQMLYPQGQS